MRHGPPGWGVEVNETALLMTQTMPGWWLHWRARAEDAGRIRVITSGIGDRIFITYDDRPTAEAMVVSLTCSMGLPRSAVKLRRDDRRPATKGTAT